MNGRADSAPLPGIPAPLCIWGRQESAAPGATGSPTSFLRKRVAEASQRLHVATPVGKHLDPQVEEHRLADEALDLEARRTPELANSSPLVAHEDAFLALALDVDDRTNVYWRSVLAKLLDAARNAVWHFVL